MTATGPLLAAQVPRISVDPYADAVTASPVRFLYRLNPLAKLLAPVPAMIMLIFVRDAATPLAFLLLSYALLLVGRELHAASGAHSAASPCPSAPLAIGFGFALWTDPSQRRPERRRVGSSGRGRCTAELSSSGSPPACASRRSSRWR